MAQRIEEEEFCVGPTNLPETDSNKNNAILTDLKNNKVSKHCKVSKYSNY